MIITDEEMARINGRLDKMNAELIEMGCDSVRIFVTARMQNGNTGFSTKGEGNIFSQIGHVEYWLRDQNRDNDVEQNP